MVYSDLLKIFSESDEGNVFQCDVSRCESLKKDVNMRAADVHVIPIWQHPSCGFCLLDSWEMGEYTNGLCTLFTFYRA
jgi:hypothetical protein